MAWTLEHPTLFDWEWSVVHSAFGAACGTAGTVEEAVMEMTIAEADLLEEPYATQSKAKMRADPKDWFDHRFNNFPAGMKDRIKELEDLASGFGSKSPSYGG